MAAFINRLNPTHGYYTAGRYVRFYGRFGAWIGVNLKAWREHELTPLWYQVYVPSPFSGIGDKSMQEVRSLLAVRDLDDDMLYIPIHLLVGAERDGVVDDAVEQILDIANRFRTLFSED